VEANDLVVPGSCGFPGDRAGADGRAFLPCGGRCGVAGDPSGHRPGDRPGLPPGRGAGAAVHGRAPGHEGATRLPGRHHGVARGGAMGVGRRPVRAQVVPGDREGAGHRRVHADPAVPTAVQADAGRRPRERDDDHDQHRLDQEAPGRPRDGGPRADARDPEVPPGRPGLADRGAGRLRAVLRGRTGVEAGRVQRRPDELQERLPAGGGVFGLARADEGAGRGGQAERRHAGRDVQARDVQGGRRRGPGRTVGGVQGGEEGEEV
ncbi:MAG: hypothetical protein AVDCRST_MAG64-2643, partial [uncultured Phycisphaerae bacterium]